MLDAFIIDEIVKRQSRIDEDDARPVIQIQSPTLLMKNALKPCRLTMNQSGHHRYLIERCVSALMS